MATRLDHCNIRTFDLDGTIKFYSDVVGLKDGDFPGSRSMGAWLYDVSERPILHIIAIDPKDPQAALDRVRDRLGSLAGDLDLSSMKGGGAVDHIAFECDDYDGMADKLTGLGLYFTRNEVPSINLRQLFVNDPNGITLELNFR
ncbi:MAG TPA: VOC family protein [Alphaproteobacteria bacterium]|nr:VOC family protein [Alphaproteobacteria bacterium]